VIAATRTATASANGIRSFTSIGTIGNPRDPK
jgi:hypothetical protein